MHSPSISTLHYPCLVVGRRAVRAAAAFFFLMTFFASTASAQLPAGVTATVTQMAPVVEVTTDPVTGQSTTSTTRTTILDVKHENHFEYNNCTSELVNINGKQTFTISEKVSSSGVTTMQQHVLENGTGDCELDCLGSTPAHYSFLRESHSIDTVTGDIPEGQQAQSNSHLTRSAETGAISASCPNPNPSTGLCPDDWVMQFVFTKTSAGFVPHKFVMECR